MKRLDFLYVLRWRILKTYRTICVCACSNIRAPFSNRFVYKSIIKYIYSNNNFFFYCWCVIHTNIFFSGSSPPSLMTNALAAILTVMKRKTKQNKSQLLFKHWIWLKTHNRTFFISFLKKKKRVNNMKMETFFVFPKCMDWKCITININTQSETVIQTVS